MGRAAALPYQIKSMVGRRGSAALTNSLLKQRLRELFGVEGLQVVRLLAEVHFGCRNLSNSLSSGDQ
jgi:hypothetical protein